MSKPDAEKAGMVLKRLRGVTSDGAKGLQGYLRRQLHGVRQQRCLWHIRHNLQDKVKAAATAQGLGDEAARLTRQEVPQTLNALSNAILATKTYAQAEAALATLQGHALGAVIAQFLNAHFDALLVSTLDYYHDLSAVNPEWIWRDFRLRRSHERNHGSAQHLAQGGNCAPGTGLGHQSQLHAAPGSC